MWVFRQFISCTCNWETDSAAQTEKQAKSSGLSRDPRPARPSPHWGRSPSACRVVPPHTHLSGKRLSSFYSSPRPGSLADRPAARTPAQHRQPEPLPAPPQPAVCALCYGVADGDGAAPLPAARGRWGRHGTGRAASLSQRRHGRGF